MSLFRAALVCLFAVSLAIAGHAAVPATVNLSGSLVDASGQPSSGTYAYRVQFFDAATAGSQLGGDVTGTVEVSASGVFSISLQPPAALVDNGGGWYELAIDANADGMDASDVLAPRVLINSVPFTLRADNAAALAGTAAVDYATDAEVSAALAGKADATHTHTLSALDGAVTDAQVPDDITAADYLPLVGGTLTGAVTATAYYGDGSNLTGLATPTLQTVTDQGATTATTVTVPAVVVSGTSGAPGELGSIELTYNSGLPPIPNTNKLYNANGALLWGNINLLNNLSAQDGDPAGVIQIDADGKTTITSASGQDMLIKPGGTTGTSGQVLQTDGSGVVSWANDLAGLPTSASQYVFPELADGMDDTQRGSALLEAISTARQLGPGATHRVTVLVPPGDYDLEGQSIELTVPYLELVGLSGNREAQYIYSGPIGTGSGVIYQTADHVRLENLKVECTNSSGSHADDSSDPAAYYPCVTWNSGSAIGSSANTVVKNCEFVADTSGSNAWPMRISDDTFYAGTYEDCAGGASAFGAQGLATGRFINCTAGDDSFGSESLASGSFINCTAGNNSFGGSGGTASGSFEDCTGGTSAFGGGGGTASGTFTDCTAGNDSFGGNDWAHGGTTSGTFTRCTAGTYSFGTYSLNAITGTFTDCTSSDHSFGYESTVSGTFLRCTADGGFSFGGAITSSAVFRDCHAGDSSFGRGYTTEGSYTDCTAGDRSFGGYLGTAAGTYINCQGGNYAFGGGGTASGTFEGCTGGNYAFGGYGGSTASGTFTGCTGGDYSFGGAGGTASGFYNNCIGEDQSFGGGDGTASGVFRYCTAGFYGFGGGSGGTGTASGGNFYFCEGESDAFTTNGSPTVVLCIRGGSAYP